ncbi:hypothetical protein CZ787_17290 [Halomonas citrativorans]|uniref:Uncharacterized protein n=1 Tax=Halomonas citrativorans TaxID=2742612 RepID=A0A1R4I595_9GAMM|nr:hypothetical protein CZ787_17290 [Halomonas citrativorans]
MSDPSSVCLVLHKLMNMRKINKKSLSKNVSAYNQKGNVT